MAGGATGSWWSKIPTATSSISIIRTSRRAAMRVHRSVPGRGAPNQETRAAEATDLTVALSPGGLSSMILHGSVTTATLVQRAALRHICATITYAIPRPRGSLPDARANAGGHPHRTRVALLEPSQLPFLHSILARRQR